MSSVTVLKNYILIADVCNSIQFLVWRDEDYSLTLLAKDFDSHICLNTSFIIDGARLGILLSDAESNLQLLQFNPRYVSIFTYSTVFDLVYLIYA